VLRSLVATERRALTRESAKCVILEDEDYKSTEGLAKPELCEGFGADRVMRPVSPHPPSAMTKVAMDCYFPTLLTANGVSLVRDAG
jgi:hypothetical protein